MNFAVAFCDFDLFIFCFTYYIVSLLLPCVDSRGRCQNHVYFSPHLRVKGAPSSCLSPPAAAPTACHAMAGRHTTGRCQSHWWLCLPRVSSRSSLTHDTQSRVSPPWDPRALHVRQLSTPWLSNRSLETSASIPVSQREALYKICEALITFPCRVLWVPFSAHHLQAVWKQLFRTASRANWERGMCLAMFVLGISTCLLVLVCSRGLDTAAHFKHTIILKARVVPVKVALLAQH